VIFPSSFKGRCLTDLPGPWINACWTCVMFSNVPTHFLLPTTFVLSAVIPVISNLLINLFITDPLWAFLHSYLIQNSHWTCITLAVCKIFSLKHMLFCCVTPYCLLCLTMLPLGTAKTAVTTVISDVTHNGACHILVNTIKVGKTLYLYHEATCSWVLCPLN